MNAKPELDRDDIQKLVLTGVGAECCRHLLLRVVDAAAARRFLGELLRLNWIRHADADAGDNHPLAADGRKSAVNVGFGHEGLLALELDQALLDVFASFAPAFKEGARQRAAEHLADAGDSAAERWEPCFAPGQAQVLLSIHADDEAAIDEIAGKLRLLEGAEAGLSGWHDRSLQAQHLPPLDGSPFRPVHFGFADGIARPTVLPGDRQPHQIHEPGELLLGHANDDDNNRWATKSGTADFFRNGSFGILRKIEQHVERFDKYIERTAAEKEIDAGLLRAKLCGRWPNGALVKPGELTEPKAPPAGEIDDFDFSKDKKGLGCPFGSHIRRLNPRSDPVAPKRQRPLFRRGMPYGKPAEEDPKGERGLLGLFFCASIEDQFEHLLSNWADRVPVGPDNRGTAKDPLIGDHDDPAAGFHIPGPGDGLMLKGLEPFVTTKGTVYAFYPGLSALATIARYGTEPSRAIPRELKPEEQPLRVKIADDTAPRDRYCDLVMEGGVTSGIIYSSLVAELAKHYRFHSIAGTSIGAFAAAVTAAAELRRRNGYIDGYQFIHDLPDLLAKSRQRKAAKDDAKVDAENDAKDPPQPGDCFWLRRKPKDLGDEPLLRRLFRAEPQTSRLFEIFLATLNRKSDFEGVFSALRAAFSAYRCRILPAVGVTLLVTLFGPLALTALAWPAAAAFLTKFFAATSLGATLLLSVFLAFTAAVIIVAASIVVDLVRGLVPNGFGLCRGGPAEGDEDPEEPTLALAIHLLVQSAAGRKAGDPPVTFDDLWRAPGYPPKWLPTRDGVPVRSIDLQMYGTNLTHSRPYRFPSDGADDMARLFFKPQELAQYLPKPLFGTLLGFSRPYRQNSASDPHPSKVPADLRELPTAKMPIAVAARLSLSFPLLISAVPLWAIDYEPRRGDRRLRRCWFSDGGLCVNFPIHLFDSFIPKWPTFGISLQTRGTARPDQRVWLPRRHDEGRGDSWDRRLDNEDDPGITRLGSFLSALWNATWSWNDASTARMPGVRDRVVRILLKPGEGGVNIRMSAQQIRDLANDYGYPAAREIYTRFVASRGWDEHRWVRFNALLTALRERIEGLAVAAELDRHTTPLSKQIEEAAGEPALDGPEAATLDSPQAQELRDLLAALKALEAKYQAAGNYQPYVAVPPQELRLRPRI